jgi:hypothetical protein
VDKTITAGKSWEVCVRTEETARSGDNALERERDLAYFTSAAVKHMDPGTI